MSFSIPMLSGSAAATVSQILAQKRKQALDTAAVDPATQNNGGQSEIQNYAPETQSTAATVAPAIQSMPAIAQTAAAMPAAPVDTSAFGGPPPAPPLQHSFDPNRTRNGLVRQPRSDFDNISRRRSMVEALATGLQAGGIGGGLAGLVTGLVSKGIGRNLAFNRANDQFNQEKATEEALDRGDPGFQESIQTKAAYDREPLKRYEESKAEEDRTNRATTVENLRQQGQMKKAQLVAGAALERAKLNGNNRATLANANNLAKATLDTRKIAAGFTGQQWYEALSDADKASAVGDEWQRQQDIKTDYTQAKTGLANSRGDEIDAITKNLPQKFADAHKRLDGYLQNVQTNAGRLKLQQGNADQRAENERQLRQGAALQSELNSLEEDHKRQYSVLNNPYNSTPDKQPLIDAARKRIQEIDTRVKEINEQRLDTAGAPKRGQKATRPGAGQPTGKVVSSGELKAYADANFGGDLSKAKEAYLHHARERGITVTFQ